MSKLPYMKWYPSDFDTDEVVRMMNFEQVGFYLVCLNHSWMNSGLPGDLDSIAAVFKLSRPDFDRLWRLVGSRFDLVDGRYVNPRQEKERADANKKSESSRKSANARWQQEPADSTGSGNSMRTQCERNANAMPRAYDSDSGSDSSVSSSELLSVDDDLEPRHVFPKRPDDEPDENQARARLPNPEDEFALRLRQRHGDRVDPAAIIRMTKQILHEDRTEFTNFLEFDEKQTTAPQKLRNPGGHYRTLVHTYLFTRAQAKALKARELDRQTRTNTATKTPPPSCSLGRCSGTGELYDQRGIHPCECEIGKALPPAVVQFMNSLRKPQEKAEVA